MLCSKHVDVKRHSVYFPEIKKKIAVSSLVSNLLASQIVEFFLLYPVQDARLVFLWNVIQISRPMSLRFSHDSGWSGHRIDEDVVMVCQSVVEANSN